MAYITGKAERSVWKFFKVIIVLGIITGAVGGYLYFHPETWKPWVKGTPFEPAPTVTRVYKWQDQNGEWQMTDQPPPGGVKYETLIYSSNTNVTPSMDTDKK